MLLAWATHSDGPGIERAHLLVWNPTRQYLEGRLSWTRAPGGESLEETLRHAQRVGGEGPDPESTRRLRAVAYTLDELDDAVRAAWASGSMVLLPRSRAPLVPWEGAARLAVVTVSREARPYGVWIGELPADRPEPSCEAALTRLAELFRRAHDAHARAERVRESASRLEALRRTALTGVSSLNIGEAAAALAQAATDASGARGAALWTLDARGGLVLTGCHGPAGTRTRVALALQPIAVAIAEAGRSRCIDSIAAEDELPAAAAAQLTGAAFAPIQAFERTAGVLAVYDRLALHPSETFGFGPEDLQTLETIADVAGSVLEHARRGAELQRTRGRQRELRRELSRRERWASLGERAARMSHELRNPLASIGAFARRVQRSLAEDDPQREYLDVVIREAARLEAQVAEHAELAELEPPDLKLESLNAVIQESLQTVGEALVRSRVRLLKKLTPDLPPMLLHGEPLRRVVGNLLGQALEAVATGGRIRVETRRVQQHAVLEVAHDGLRAPGDLADQLFVPFTLGRQGASHLGLAVARQVVQDHGGEIRLRSEGEWSTIFSLTLPIAINEDRRHSRHDRRGSASDRRSRHPIG